MGNNFKYTTAGTTKDGVRVLEQHSAEKGKLQALRQLIKKVKAGGRNYKI